MTPPAERARANTRTLFLIALGLLCGATFAAPVDGTAYRDWVVRCETIEVGSPGSESGDEAHQCFLVQNLVLKENQQRVLLIAVTYPPAGDEPVAVLTLPLGIILPPGVALRIDGGSPRRYGVERCIRSGCKAGFVLDPELLQAFKSGIKAEFTVYDVNRQPVTLPVSLVGFTAGLAALR